MKSEDVIQKFRESGALLEGHFVLTSGLHSAVYLQCALVLQDPRVAEEFGRAITEKFSGAAIQTVAAPAIGGIVIGHEVARALGVRFIWTERENGTMGLRRGFSVRRRARVGRGGCRYNEAPRARLSNALRELGANYWGCFESSIARRAKAESRCEANRTGDA